MCGNANSLFLIAPEGLKILNIQDGTERKSIGIWEQQLRASAARLDDDDGLSPNFIELMNKYKNKKGKVISKCFFDIIDITYGLDYH